MALGGHLPAVRDAGENGSLCQTAESLGGQSRLGFNARNVEGQFEWLRGLAALYTNWNTDEP